MMTNRKFLTPNYFILCGCILAIVNQSEAECCNFELFVRHNCVGKWCYSFVCPDGTLFYRQNCGVGSCNIFGCNCDGGCRRNSKGFDKNEALALFQKRYKTHIKCVTLKKISEEYISCMENL